MLEVVDKGYLLHEKVIRHARVIVSADAAERSEVRVQADLEQEDEHAELGERGDDRLGGVDQPERRLADDDAGEVVADRVRLAVCGSELHDLAVGRDQRQPEHVVDGEAVLEAVRAARVLRDVAADRRDLVRGGVGRVEEAHGGGGIRNLQRGHAGLDQHRQIRAIHFEDAVHLGRAHHYAVGRG